MTVVWLRQPNEEEKKNMIIISETAGMVEKDGWRRPTNIQL